jgi:hypothetical protein
MSGAQPSGGSTVAGSTVGSSIVAGSTVGAPFTQTSSAVDATTRIAKHRLRIVGRTRDVKLQQRISGHESTYFSIV